MLAYQIVVTLLLLLFAGLALRNLRDYAVLDESATPDPAERLYVLIPARNEEENIRACLDGLTAQVGCNFCMVVLDDESTDATASVVLEAARDHPSVELIRGKPIPAGWAGKVWACSQLGSYAIEQGADWLLFLDADTRAAPRFVAALWAQAQATRADMVSSFPYQVTGSLMEMLVLPMLHFLVVTFLPIRMVWETPNPAIAAACGQVGLFSAEGYRRIGGHAAVSASFHDGLQLARRVKQLGGTLRLTDASRSISCRMYRGARQVWAGFTRNAYEGLGSMGALVTMTLLNTVLFVAPIVFCLYGLLAGHGTYSVWFWLACAQVAMILAMRVAQARRFGHMEAVLLHPISVIVMLAIQWTSWFRHVTHARTSWKDRSYTAAPEKRE
jgi:chlorobactene glucosyltransferase